MNMNELALKITQLEKGKVEVNIAQTKEILAKLSDVLVSKDGPDVIATLIKNGKRRNK